MCKVRVTKCPVCGHGMKCEIDPCNKVRLADQVCGVREKIPDKISAQMCEECYKDTKSVTHKAKKFVKKAMGGGSSSKGAASSSHASSSKVRTAQGSYTARPVPLLDEDVAKALSKIAEGKRRGPSKPPSAED